MARFEPDRSSLDDFVEWTEKTLDIDGLTGATILGVAPLDALATFRLVCELETLLATAFPTDLLDVLATLEDLHHFAQVKAGHPR